MRSILVAGLVAAFLGGCAAPPGGTSAADAGAPVLAAVGTPFLIVAKIPACILTIVAAGPVGAVAQLSDPSDLAARDVKQGLAEGIAENCGPPYVVAP